MLVLTLARCQFKTRFEFSGRDVFVTLDNEKKNLTMMIMFQTDKHTLSKITVCLIWTLIYSCKISFRKLNFNLALEHSSKNIHFIWILNSFGLQKTMLEVHEKMKSAHFMYLKVVVDSSQIYVKWTLFCAGRQVWEKLNLELKCKYNLNIFC